MKVYIQTGRDGLPYNTNAYAAWQGFGQMGFETGFFDAPEALSDIPLTDMVVGGVGRVKGFLESRGIAVADIDYPECLKVYYGRKIWETTTGEFLKERITAPVFVKPKLGKRFNGFVCRGESDVVGRLNPREDELLYCSEVVELRAEWRCFVRYGKILDIRRYAGELGLIYDLNRVREMTEAYEGAPAAYALDIGLNGDGQTVIVEVNDGYSLGCYGLDPLLYAKLLAARWAELAGTEDECDF